MFHRLVITLLALMLFVSVHAAGNSTLSCSFKMPSVAIGCFVETPVFAVHNFEVAVGVNAEWLGVNDSVFGVAGYAIFAWYDDSWSAWVELVTPRLVNVIGDHDWLRAGFTMRF